jgi:hypothetical protein
MRPTINLVPIPGLGYDDVAVVQSLLKGAGFFCRVHQARGEDGFDAILIREADRPAVKEFLRDYRTRGPGLGNLLTPIPW